MHHLRIINYTERWTERWIVAYQTAVAKRGESSYAPYSMNSDGCETILDFIRRDEFHMLKYYLASGSRIEAEQSTKEDDAPVVSKTNNYVPYTIYTSAELYYWHQRLHTLVLGTEVVSLVASCKRLLRNAKLASEGSKIGIVGPFHAGRLFERMHDGYPDTMRLQYEWQTPSEESARELQRLLYTEPNLDETKAGPICQEMLQTFLDNPEIQAIILSDFEVERLLARQSIAEQINTLFDPPKIFWYHQETKKPIISAQQALIDLTTWLTTANSILSH